MERFINDYGTRCMRVLTILILWAGLLCHGHAWGNDASGLTLNLYIDEDHPELQFLLGSPIKLTMVIANTSERPIHTERGFSQVELYHSLFITDPGGKRHTVGPGTTAHKMPPPFFINGLAWSLAETLTADWVRSANIYDLCELLPMMKKTPGWYTIEAQQPFVRFASYIQDPGLGLLGQQDYPENWHGTVNSEKMQIYVSPSGGAQLQVQVTIVKNGSENPLGQVPVRVFENTGTDSYNPFCDFDSDGDIDGSDLSVFAADFGRTGCNNDCKGDFDNDQDVDGSDLSVFAASFGTTGGFVPHSSWSTLEPLMVGTSNFEGRVVWDSRFACLPEDKYAVVGYYQGEYELSLIAPGTGVGWNTGCTGSIERIISFNEAQPDNGMISISGGAYNYPEGLIYRASFSMYVTGPNAPSGWLKYYYSRTRMNFMSTEITEVSVTGNTHTISGSGKVNDAEGFTFVAQVIDGVPDIFGITIYKPNGSIHYSAGPETIAGGDLIISNL